MDVKNQLKCDEVGDTLVLNLDNCNQDCLFCMKSEDIRKKRKITYEMVADAISAAKASGFRTIDFFGGEPTTYPFLGRAAKLAQDCGMKVGIATNATMFASSEYAVNFFRELDVTKGVSFRSSLHGMEKIHDRLVQRPGAYKKALKGMGNILKHTDHLTVNIVITSLNLENLTDVIEALHAVGVKAVKFSNINNVGKATDNQWLAVEQKTPEANLKKAIKRSQDLNFKFIEVVNMPGFWLKYKDKFKNLKHDKIN